jgi:hypothetical protein
VSVVVGGQNTSGGDCGGLRVCVDAARERVLMATSGIRPLEKAPIIGANRIHLRAVTVQVSATPSCGPGSDTKTCAPTMHTPAQEEVQGRERGRAYLALFGDDPSMLIGICSFYDDSALCSRATHRGT